MYTRMMGRLICSAGTLTTLVVLVGAGRKFG